MPRYIVGGEDLPAPSLRANAIRRGAWGNILRRPYDTYSRSSGYPGPVLGKLYVPDYVPTPLGILPAYHGELPIGQDPGQPILPKPHPSGVDSGGELRKGWRLSLKDFLGG
jgi:hypothetical protein